MRHWEMTDEALNSALLAVALSGENAIQLISESNRRNLKVPPGVYNLTDVALMHALEEN